MNTDKSFQSLNQSRVINWQVQVLTLKSFIFFRRVETYLSPSHDDLSQHLRLII